MTTAAWLDRVTGRVSMYRMMSYVLAGIAVVALALSLFPGTLAFSTLQLAATLAVALFSTAVVGRLFALVFRTKVHGESSLITGFLIFFLFFPTTDVHSLLVVALVGAIASASKFVLAIRRRHIFNPVAIAAVIIAWTQLGAAVWWVGTPVLLVPVVIGGFLVAWRVRRFALVGGFIIVALALSTLRLSLAGASVGTAFWLSLGSAPIVFFACFMLDEPLTLPPQRWQQFSVALVAAVIMEIPFHFWIFYSSPELGLVVANVIAFIFGTRRSIRLYYVGARKLTPTAHELSFTPAKRVAFRPGQFMEVTLPHSRSDGRGVRRTFSVSSAPGSSTVAFGVKVPQRSSSYKRAIADLAAGTRLHATTVGGDFVLPRDTTVPLLLVAGGIGVTPFISQLRHMQETGEARDIVLVYAVGDDELAYADELETFGIPVFVVAPNPPESLPVGWTYLGSDRLQAKLLDERVPRLRSRSAYVSGAPAMVSALRRDLRELGVRRVKTDYFTGY